MYKFLLRLTDEQQEKLEKIKEALSKEFVPVSTNKTIQYLINDYQIDKKEDNE